MWGTRASDYSVIPRRESMKWHLVDEASLEEREITVGWGPHEKPAQRTYGYLDCGRKGNVRPYAVHDYKLPLVIKEEINLFQANVCTYCRNARLREAGIETKMKL